MAISRDIDVFSPNQYEDVYYEAAIVAKRAPTVNDKYEIGKIWIDTTNDDAYFMTNVTAGSAVWINAGGGTGVFASITATTGDITATLGDIVASAGDLISTAGSATLGGLTQGVLLSSAAGVVSSSTGTNGQVLIGVTATGVPVWSNITSGTLVITNGAGTINMEESGGTANSYITQAGGPVAPLAGALTVSGYDANITTDGATANTLKVRLSDDVTTIGALTAGVDLNMSAGDCTINATTDAAQAIYLHADAGVTESIDIHSDQGTDVASVYLHSDVGGITLASGLASPVAISINSVGGGISMASSLAMDLSSAQNASDAISIEATNGGIDINSLGAAGEDIDITASSSVNLVSTENAALALYLHANGGVLETIDIHSDQGTDVASINVHSDLGGITLTAAGNATNDAINLAATAGGIDVDAALQINVASSQAAADAIVIDASNAAGGIDVDYGTGGMTVDGANGAFTLQTGTGNILIGADAVQHNVTLGNVTGTSTVTLNSGTGGVAINTTGAGDFVVTSADTVLIDSAGVLELNSSAGVIGIGTDDIDQNINIGTVGERVVTIGNVVGVTGIALNSGTAGIGLASTGAGDITINSSDTLLLDSAGVLELDSSAGVIGIGTDDIDQNINIGTVGERVVTIGNVVGVTGIALNAGTGSIALASTGASPITVNSGSTVLIDSAGVIELNSSAGAISIANDDIDQNVNISTDGERILTLGSANGAASVVVNGGTTACSFATNATDHATNVGSVTGVSATTISAGTGGLTFAAAGIVDMVPVAASHASTVTINANVGVATLTGFTTAAAASETIVITNSVCTTTSAILCSASNLGANNAQMTITRIEPKAGSFEVTVTNSGDAALNGNCVITFWIIAA